MWQLGVSRHARLPRFLPTLPIYPTPRAACPTSWLQIDSVIAACKHRNCVRALFSATLPEAVEGLARSVLKDPLRITVGERNTGELQRVGGLGCVHTASAATTTTPLLLAYACRPVTLCPLTPSLHSPLAAATTVKQRLLFVGREEGKLLALRQLIGEGMRPPVLVFVATKERAKELHRWEAFHGCSRWLMLGDAGWCWV